MPNTYTQIHIHTVFAVQNRESLIDESWREQLYQYITAIIQNHGHKVLATGGTADHVHILIGLRPTQALSDLMRDVKRNTSEWINRQRFTNGRFEWQEGFGAFSYSKSQIPVVARYIENQKEHHAKKSFLDEYRTMLEKFEIEYDNRYVFCEID